jgi:hypothetical protein
MWLQFWFLGLPRFGGASRDADREKAANVKSILQNHYAGLGRMTYHEKSVLCLMVTLVALWCTRDPGFFPGWGELFGLKKSSYFKEDKECNDNCSLSVGHHDDACVEECAYERRWRWAEAADDATAGMAVVILLFALPRALTFWPFEKSNSLYTIRQKKTVRYIPSLFHCRTSQTLAKFVDLGRRAREDAVVAGLARRRRLRLGRRLQEVRFVQSRRHLAGRGGRPDQQSPGFTLGLHDGNRIRHGSHVQRGHRQRYSPHHKGHGMTVT